MKIIQRIVAALVFIFSVFYVPSIFANTNKFISYTDVGKGRALVLIHAFPTDGRLYTPQTNGLKDYFRVITIDLWGFGKSAAVDGSAISMNDYADEVKQLLDQLHIEKAIIGGESMGGYVALAMYAKYPERVSGLLLSNTQAIADSDEAKQKREETAVDVLQHGTANVINSFMKKAISANASANVRQYLQEIVTSQPATALAAALRGMSMRADTSSVLANVDVPVLIISGEHDEVISPQQSRNMHELAKNSQLVIIPNAAHLSNLEQPQQWNQAVINGFANH